MTLLTIEGFETRSSRLGWTHNTFSAAGRFGGICATSGEATYILPEAAEEVVMGFAYRSTSLSDHALLSIFTKGNTVNESMRLHRRADHSLAIHRRSPNSSLNNIPVAIGAGPFADTNVWAYVEVRVRIAPVGGYFDVRVNGAPYVSFVGDTAPNSGDNNISMIRWTNIANAMAIDDVYICNRLGSEFNDFIGEIQVEGLFPNGNGASSQLVGSDGNSVDNYLLVDEVPAVETDLVQSDVVGAKDTYQFDNPSVTSGQVLAVQTSAAISKANAGPASAKLVERLANGTERKSTPFPATNLTTYSNVPQTRDPEGAVWTPASVSAAEFGVEVA